MKLWWIRLTISGMSNYCRVQVNLISHYFWNEQEGTTSVCLTSGILLSVIQSPEDIDRALLSFQGSVDYLG